MAMSGTEATMLRQRLAEQGQGLELRLTPCSRCDAHRVCGQGMQASPKAWQRPPIAKDVCLSGKGGKQPDPHKLTTEKKRTDTIVLPSCTPFLSSCRNTRQTSRARMTVWILRGATHPGSRAVVR